MQVEDEREEVDIAEEEADSEPKIGAHEAAADAAEEVAERDADAYEDRDQLTGDDPPPA